MIEFAYTLRLPRELGADIGALERNGVPNGSVVAGGGGRSTFVEVAVQGNGPKEKGGRRRAQLLPDDRTPIDRSLGTTDGQSANHSYQSLHWKQRPQSVDNLQQQRERQPPPPPPTPPPQWIAQRTDHLTVPSPIETVLISGLFTDGAGTTTIVTLGGDVTVISGGPA
eukprot:CAMPEP_0181106566 /NCGR_PEP_ID=MMETSP1071-20121207/16600_1 /TAXON_ID=35127 /ORGANISM="Thalassiosira sp., Strain NH16" /LENGTH=167 /DNA_ID=CAMNT_0023189981 /DNA_START=14 /DNA_END=514 /DNA_ORIENTATION=-